MDIKFCYLVEGTIDIIDAGNKELLDTEYFQFTITKTPDYDSVLCIVKHNFLHSDYLNSSMYELEVSFESSKINHYNLK